MPTLSFQPSTVVAATQSSSRSGEDSLDSFDQLIRDNQSLGVAPPRSPKTHGLHRRGSSGGQTIVPGYDISGSSSDCGTLEGSTATIRPAAIQPTAAASATETSNAVNDAATSKAITGSPSRPIDESRWNGFHLWRAESYQRRVSLQQQREADQRHRQEPRWYDKRKNLRRCLARLLPIRSENGSSSDAQTSRMITLTLVQAGAQIAWCLEFGYGTPYLLSLGLSKSATAMVWLAAPISGLVVQPAIGVMSDLSTSSWRRRQFIVASSVLLAWSTLVLAFSTPLASAIVDVLHVGVADWDPVRIRARDEINTFLAVTAFVFLDVSINGLQVSARALVLDVTPSALHSRATAWSARMMHAGNVFGYTVGWLDLSSSSWLAWLGDGQLRKYAVVSLLAIIVGSTVTCVTIDEAHTSDAGVDDVTAGANGENEGEIDPSFSAAASVRPDVVESPATLAQRAHFALVHIWQTFRRLPRSVRRICLVQLFANMAWFPFYFYATQWVIEVWQAENKKPTDNLDNDKQERLGSYALLLFAIVSLTSASLLPSLALANWTAQVEDDEDTEVLLPSNNGTATINTHKRPPNWLLSLRTIWTCAMAILFVQMAVLTFFARTYDTAVAVVASIGIPFAVNLWVPYALVMESVREAQDGMSPFEFEADWFSPARVQSRRRQSERHTFQRSAAPSPMSIGRANVGRAVQDCDPLQRRPTSEHSDHQHSIVSRGCRVISSNVRAVSPSPSRTAAQTSRQSAAADRVEDDVGATILGIHNIAIVLPMIVVAPVAALILRDPTSNAALSQSAQTSGVGVVWILRFGGVAALCAAILTRYVPLSRSERLLLGDRATIRQSRAIEHGSDEDEDEDVDDMQSV